MRGGLAPLSVGCCLYVLFYWEEHIVIIPSPNLVADGVGEMYPTNQACRMCNKPITDKRKAKFIMAAFSVIDMTRSCNWCEAISQRAMINLDLNIYKLVVEICKRKSVSISNTPTIYINSKKIIDFMKHWAFLCRPDRYTKIKLI